MADTKLFTRLQRLFSSDVIIRNQGGNQLKVMDVDSIQKSGDIATNSLYKIIYNSSKKFFNHGGLRLFENNPIIKFHKNYIE